MFVTSLLSPPTPRPPHLFRPIQHLLLFFLFVRPFNCLASYSRATEILYSLNEGLPAGVLIGSLAEDLRLLPSARGQDLQSQSPQHSVAERNPPLSFSLASQGLSGQYVTLDNRSGELHTSAQEIDREALCLEGGRGTAWGGSISISSSPSADSADSCLLLLDVLVLPQEYFRFVKVKIAIRDINDNAPEFTGDQVPPLPAVARGCPPPILVVGGRGGWVLRGGTLSGLCRTPG